MPQPFREAPPPAPEDPEVAELEAMLANAEARGKRRRKIMAFVLGGIVLAAVSPFIVFVLGIWVDLYKDGRAARERKLPKSEVAAARQVAAQARAAVLGRQATFRAATAPEALGALMPGRGSCPVRLRAPTAEAERSYIQYGSVDGNYFGAWTVSRLGKTKLDRLDFRLMEGIADGTGGGLAQIEDFEEKLAKGTAEKTDLSRIAALVMPSRGVDVLLQVDEEKKPVALGDTYLGGFVVGRAYVFDRDASRILCVANVDARSSPELDIRYYTRGVLDVTSKSAALQLALTRDLEVRVRSSIASSLRAAAPAVPDDSL